MPDRCQMDTGHLKIMANRLLANRILVLVGKTWLIIE
jgi:hypothetical protein